ncbi:MAG: conserved hypothetical protein [Candidatus Desulfovibrio kirbyi]|uniref:Uncharacterized protein n=1 Tax=Candidatus Desulfovibrio kirbyi TaxID=2696086 RepID=A0A6L2R6H7_9BACT|nr:MAG: conserved hypothetical protein [Candidatus Desulfovibrio kirbyi]
MNAGCVRVARFVLPGSAVFWIFLFFSFFFLAGSVPVAAPAKKNLHAPAWVFEKSADRAAALWHEGVRVQDIRDRAMSGKTANTDSGVAPAPDALGKRKKQQPLGFEMRNETSDWREATPEETARPDESLPIENRYVVRAFADVDASENLSINVGPELILKDEQHQIGKTDKQPDSSLGVGMGFKFDF